jgi:uncharacterized protein with HEPN domain
MRDDRERLLDIREAIENVQKYAARGKDYFHIDIDAVWSVVENDLPVLYDQVKHLLHE